jgi:transposase
VVSVQPRPWPKPAEVIVAAVRARYARREAPLAVQVRDRFGALFPDAAFESAFAGRGRPGWSPGRLALVTVLQMAEGLTDRQAAEAVRERLSWQYALGLGLDDPGFGHTVLSEFRARVVEHGSEERVLDLLLDRLVEVGLLGPGGKQRTDSTHVVSAVRGRNRLELAGESVRACLEALAACAPSWLAEVVDVPGWSRRYPARVDSWRLPTAQAKRTELALAYARDGSALVQACYRADAPGWVREVEAVGVLRVVLLQNYPRARSPRPGRRWRGGRQSGTVFHRAGFVCAPPTTPTPGGVASGTRSGTATRVISARPATLRRTPPAGRATARARGPSHARRPRRAPASANGPRSGPT